MDYIILSLMIKDQIFSIRIILSDINSQTKNLSIFIEKIDWGTRFKHEGIVLVLKSNLDNFSQCGWDFSENIFLFFRILIETDEKLITWYFFWIIPKTVFAKNGEQISHVAQRYSMIRAIKRIIDNIKNISKFLWLFSIFSKISIDNTLFIA